MSFITKICGLANAGDAAFCARLGADWLGFIFHPASPRRAEPKAVAGFETGPALRAGVFVDLGVEEIKRIMREARLDLAQLHGGQSPDFCRAVGAERVIKVFWPERPNLEEEMAAFKDAAAYCLLDGGVKGGGHGRTLDLASLRLLRPPRPWLLAGGLDADGARAAAKAGLSGLAGFDFNSRVEISPGLKDHRLVAAALAAGKEEVA